MKTHALHVKDTDSPIKRHAGAPSASLKSNVAAAEIRQILRGPVLQTQLTFGAPDDEYEREADRVAEANTIQGGGQPLPTSERAFFEPRFGFDLGGVRLHVDHPAAQASRALRAKAFTLGNDVFFGEGQFAPASPRGRRLLAHELTHVVQQNSAISPKLQRKEIMFDNLEVNVSFDPLYEIEEDQTANQILSMITNFLDPSYLEEYRKKVDYLDSEPRRWVMFALQFLMDNSESRSTSRKEASVHHLFEFAPMAVQNPSENESFIREVFQAWGRLEQIVTSELTAPERETAKQIKQMLDTKKTRGKLQSDELKRRLVPALEYWLRKKDPRNWEEPKGHRSLPVYQTLGDIILEEARSFFAPYAGATRSNIFSQYPVWRGSTHIYDVDAGRPHTDLDLFGLLSNRAFLVGNNTDPADSDFNDTNIFSEVSFSDNRSTDMESLNAILIEMLKDDSESGIRDVVDRMDRTTGERREKGIGPVIGISATYDTAEYASACEAHWKAVDTLCHEIVHAMVDPRFTEAVDRANDQVIKEGFTEVLGAQLYNDHIVPKSEQDRSFKLTMEASIQGYPCPTPARATIDYGDAGRTAEAIWKKIGDDNFRAAYFLGRPDLIGL